MKPSGRSRPSPPSAPPLSAAAPLSRERVVAAAMDVIRRHGPTKATVVDVARALGVSHTAVYRHVATKAELRDLVVQAWVEATMPPLRAMAVRPAGTPGSPRSAPERLRRFYRSLADIKCQRAAEDPELFAAYRALAADAKSVSAAHLSELVDLSAAMIRAGVEAGSFRAVDPQLTARAILFATSRFHHPAHFAEWSDPTLAATFDEVWRLLMDGLSATPRSRR